MRLPGRTVDHLKMDRRSAAKLRCGVCEHELLVGRRMTNPTNPEPAVLTPEMTRSMLAAIDGPHRHTQVWADSIVADFFQCVADGLTICKPASAEREMQERLKRMEAALLEVDEYLAGRAEADWRQGAEHPTPNEEMRLQVIVQEALK